MQVGRRASRVAHSRPQYIAITITHFLVRCALFGGVLTVVEHPQHAPVASGTGGLEQPVVALYFNVVCYFPLYQLPPGSWQLPPGSWRVTYVCGENSCGVLIYSLYVCVFCSSEEISMECSEGISNHSPA